MSFSRRSAYTADIILHRVRPPPSHAVVPNASSGITVHVASRTSSFCHAVKQLQRRRGPKQRSLLLYAETAIGWGSVSFCWKAQVAAGDGAMLVVKFAHEGLQADLEREAAIYGHLGGRGGAATGSGVMTSDWPCCYGLFSGSGFTGIVVDNVGEPLYDRSMLAKEEK
jgi:hypothetical protein